MADTVNLRTKQTWLHHTVVRLVTDNIVRNDVVVPDFNVCTNTSFSYTSKHSVDHPP